MKSAPLIVMGDERLDELELEGEQKILEDKVQVEEISSAPDKFMRD